MPNQIPKAVEVPRSEQAGGYSHKWQKATRERKRNYKSLRVRGKETKKAYTFWHEDKDLPPEP